MSLKQNDEWLESKREEFESYLSEGDGHSALMVCEELDEAGFEAEARDLLAELKAIEKQADDQWKEDQSHIRD